MPDSTVTEESHDGKRSPSSSRPSDDLRALARLWPALRPHRGRFAQTVVSSMVLHLAGGVAAVGTAALAGHAVAGGAGSWPDAFVVVAGVVTVGAALAVGAATWAEMYVAHDLAYLVLARLRVTLFDRLRRTQPARTGRRRTGDLAVAAMGDVESLEWIYAHVFAQVGTAAVTFVVGAVAVALVDPVLLTVAVPAGLVSLTVPWWLARSGRRDDTALAAERAGYAAELLDTLGGVAELTAARAMPRRVAQLAARELTREQVRSRVLLRQSTEAAMLETIVALAGLAAVAVVIVGIADGSMTVAAAPVALALMGAMLGPAAAVATTLKDLGGLRAAATRLFELLDAPDQVGRAVPPPKAPDAAATGGLLLEQVRFGYLDDTPVLHGVDLAVARGETVAIAGSSGNGKSTLVDLVRRFWDPDAGRILVDGVDLRHLDDDALRRRVAVVEQDVRVFSGSLRDNLALGAPEATDAEIDDACRVAGFTEVVAGLPEGRETVVGERGAGLSGGQAARLAIARALVMSPSVLVLDEATAQLDAAAELALLRALRTTAASRATVIVTHRRSTIERADRVVVLEDGRIVADGPPAQLAADARGPWARLWRADGG